MDLADSILVIELPKEVTVFLHCCRGGKGVLSVVEAE